MASTKEEQPTGKLLSLRGAFCHEGKREGRGEGSYRSSKEELGIELRATGIGGGISSLRTTISLTYLFYLRSIHGMS